MINTGTVDVVQNSKTLTFSGVDLTSVIAGNRFKVNGEVIEYTIVTVTVISSTSATATILEAYAGSNQTAVSFQIFTDFYDYNLKVINTNTVDNPVMIDHNFKIIADELGALNAPNTKYQITTKIYIGEPETGREWAIMKFTPDAVISKVRLYTDNYAPDGSLVADLAIDGTYQNINITVPANNLWSTDNTLTSAVDAGEFTKLKWTTVPAMPGNNWFAEITWYAVTPLITRYDCLAFLMGDLEAGRILGQGYKYPVASKLFGIHYEFTGGNPPLGSSAIIEVYKDGAAIATPVTFTLPEGQLWGYLSCASTSFLTTNVQTFRINQVGSVVPGSGLLITPHTYQYTP